MKALTICQPYAHLIATGEKWVENRRWATRYQGPLAIHAGKSRAWLEGERPTSDMAFGAVVAICTLLCCVHIDEIESQGIYAKLRMHPHTSGPWCWVLQLNEVFNRPVPATGHRGLWNWERPRNRGVYNRESLL